MNFLFEKKNSYKSMADILSLVSPQFMSLLIVFIGKSNCQGNLCPKYVITTEIFPVCVSLAKPPWLLSPPPSICLLPLCSAHIGEDRQSLSQEEPLISR